MRAFQDRFVTRASAHTLILSGHVRTLCCAHGQIGSGSGSGLPPLTHHCFSYASPFRTLVLRHKHFPSRKQRALQQLHWGAAFDLPTNSRSLEDYSRVCNKTSGRWLQVSPSNCTAAMEAQLWPNWGLQRQSESMWYQCPTHAASN